MQQQRFHRAYKNRVLLFERTHVTVNSSITHSTERETSWKAPAREECENLPRKEKNYSELIWVKNSQEFHPATSSIIS